jgi:hypothetical protein
MILMIFLILPISLWLLRYSWFFVAERAIIGYLLFWLPLWRFAKTQMDFIGPEILG